jgi:hypothetical protein
VEALSGLERVRLGEEDIVRTPLCLFALLLQSCISFDLFEWKRIEVEQSAKDYQSFRVQLPIGWARVGSLLTRDGVELQRIWCHQLSEEVLQEMPSAAGLAAAIAASDNVSNVECTPVTIAGREATTIRFEGPPWPHLLFFDGLSDFYQGTYSHVLHWISDGDREFLLGYSAPTLYYFERDLPAFERFVASFEPLPPPDA